MRLPTDNFMWRIRNKVFLLASGLLFGLLIAEVCSWFIFPPAMLVSVRCGEGTLRSSYFDVENAQGLYYFDKDSWALRKDCTAHISKHYISGRTLVLRTDEYGYRRNSKPKPSGAHEILFIGDSIILGDYVEDEFTIPELYQQVMSNKDRLVHSINAGVATAGTAQEAKILRNALKQKSISLVIVNFYLNDARNCCAVRSTTIPFPFNRSTFVSKLSELVAAFTNPPLNFQLDLTEEQFFSWQGSASKRLAEREMSSEFRRLADERFASWGNMWSDEAWIRMRKDIFEMVEIANEAAVPIVFVAYPVTSQIVVEHADDFPQKELRKNLEMVQTKMLDLLPVFRRLYQEEGLLPFYDEGHPTPEGNLVIAREIKKFIESSSPNAQLNTVGVSHQK
jgi:lysophospholipase L1-like esterase